jgi:hypothetical protein
MADAFAIGASVARDPAPHGLLGWRATVLLVPTVRLRGTSESLAPGTVLDKQWGTGYYVSMEAVPQRSLGRTTVYGVLGGGVRVITTSDTSCIPEDPACDLGVGGPQTRAGLVTGGGGTSLTVGAYTLGAEAVSQLSWNRGRLQHDLALVATLRLLAW